MVWITDGVVGSAAGRENPSKCPDSKAECER